MPKTRWFGMKKSLALFPLLILGCSGEDDDKGGPPIYGTDDTGEESCAGTAPTIIYMDIVNGGFKDFEGAQWPTIKLQVEARDDDGDLEFATVEMWWDAEVDASVDTESDPLTKKIFTSDSLPCRQNDGNYGLFLQVGTGLNYNTTYDFAVRVGDASGMRSDFKIKSMTTPKEDGSDGDITEQ
jgi:hypothetical protein